MSEPPKLPPLVESAPIQQAKRWIQCAHNVSDWRIGNTPPGAQVWDLSIIDRSRQCSECGFVFTPGKARDEAIDALIQAVADQARQEIETRRATWFQCPECGPTGVDEDGCCRSCGADTTIQQRADLLASRLVEQEQGQEPIRATLQPQLRASESDQRGDDRGSSGVPSWMELSVLTAESCVLLSARLTHEDQIAAINTLTRTAKALGRAEAIAERGEQ